MKIRWLGHSCFQITNRAGTFHVLTDPFLAPLNPVAPIGVNEIDACDVVLLSHDHEDHIAHVEPVLRQTGATLVAVHEHAVRFAALGLEAEGCNIGGELTVRGMKIFVANAIHSSAAAHECGFIFEVDGLTLYFMGDTALFGDLALYRRFFSIDVVMVPIGDRYTMGPRFAAEAVRMLGARVAIPMHYNTWPPIAQDPHDLERHLAGAARVCALAPGGVYEA